ncbi:MAG: molecular chaperone DnaJ [Vicinamibacteria bacterium]|jgi:molecular chaperone DnaJ|nr:molecular chaperone DnaJ [Vicinamibacteria bacterium]MBP9945802.1 molecular chaperone DnaJ [Vicinamibacteria bacterium]
MARDYYEILEVSRTSTDQEIKSAYRKVAMKFHPDRNPGDKAAEDKFKEAAEAYSVLSDAEKRKRYDAYGHAGVSGSAGGGGFDPSQFTDFSDILGDFFGLGDPNRRRGGGGARRGADLRYTIEIDFEEGLFGATKTIRVPRHERCETCSGSGAAAGSKPTTCGTCNGTGQIAFQQGFFTVARTCGRCRGSGKIIASPCRDCRGEGLVAKERDISIKIPAGVDTGSQLRVSGEGEPGMSSAPPGDLYVVLRVRDHKDGFFKRDGTALVCEIPISFVQAILGDQVEIPMPDGTRAKVTVPEGAQPGSVLRLRGQGAPELGGRGRGDLYVQIKVVIPKKIGGEERKLLEKLGKTMSVDLNSKGKSFFEKVRDLLD